MKCWILVRFSLILAVIHLVAGQDDPNQVCDCVKEQFCKGPYYMEIKSSYDEGRNCMSDEVCCARDPYKPENPNCGRYSVDLAKSGVRGESVNKDEVPWMSIVSRVSDNSFLGSGALVHAGAVVTTASIVQSLNASDIQVRVNADTFLTDDSSSTFGVVKIIRYGYSEMYGTNNIAILILDRNLNLTGTNTVLCLPKQSRGYINTLSCYYSGWDYEIPENERSLRKYEQYVISNIICQDALRNSTHFPWWMHLHSSFLCAIPKIPKEEPTKGNQGGPLFCPISTYSDYYVLAGLVSWHDDNGLVVYTNVASFSDWIDRYLARLHDNFDEEENYILKNQLEEQQKMRRPKEEEDYDEQ